MFFKQKPAPPPPTPLPLLTLGTTLVGGKPVTVGLDRANLSIRISGLSGYGKSSLHESIFLQRLRQGACSLIDPAGDLTEDIVAYLLDSHFFEDPRAYDRLLVVRWRRRDRSVPMDVLHQPHDPYTIASNVTEMFRRHWVNLDHGQAASFDNIMLFSTAVLAESRRPLTDLLPFISSKPFRDRLLRGTTDPQIVTFFHDRFDSWGTAMTESAARRLNLLTFSPVLRSSLSQAGQNRVDFRALVLAGTSVIHDISGLDEDTQTLLGCMLMVNAEKATLSLSDIAATNRRPYTLLVDEWPAFMGNSAEAFERGLALFRKYKVSLVLANQTNSQIPKGLRGALGNVGTEVLFRQSYEDAADAAPRFTDYDPQRLGRPRSPRGNVAYASFAQQREDTQMLLQNLGKQEALVRMGDSIERIRTLDIPKPRASRGQIEAVLDRYAEMLGTPAAQVTATINERIEQTTPDGPDGAEEPIAATRRRHIEREAGHGIFAEP